MIRALRAVALALLASSCASPLGGEDLELALGASAFPGGGLLAGASQRIWEEDALRLDFEMDVLHQELSDEGPGGDDDWDQVRAGLGLRPSGAASARWIARAGAVWLRARGEAEVLDAPGDYGGLYLGLGVGLDAGPALWTGPDLSLLAVDAEGDRAGSALVAELAWRIAWRL